MDDRFAGIFKHGYYWDLVRITLPSEVATVIQVKKPWPINEEIERMYRALYKPNLQPEEVGV